tara:strand:- start:336 stop:1040 length:705 start_codon:yes stop_codon:yes gene_type:complete
VDKLTITSWPDWKDYTSFNQEQIGAIDLFNIEVPKEYAKIWKDVSMAVQIKKARTHKLSKDKMLECFKQLIKRPYFLTLLAEEYNCKNIAEVGTAEGLQFYSFAHYLQGKSGHIWSCDLRDVRNKTYTEKYARNSTFCLGGSKRLSEVIDEKIDLFYIDASHQKGAVLDDVKNLLNQQSENPVWIFDDFDERFGCYEDIRSLCEKNKNFMVYRVGDAASGNPNHQVVIFGRILL